MNQRDNTPVNQFRGINRDDDFFLKSINNRNMFLKISEDARKKYEKIRFDFEKEIINTSISMENISNKNLEINKTSNNNPQNISPNRKNAEKSKNSNLVIDYYSKIKNLAINNLAHPNFSNNLSLNKIQKDSTKNDKELNNKKIVSKNNPDKIQNYNNNSYDSHPSKSLHLNNKKDIFRHNQKTINNKQKINFLIENQNLKEKIISEPISNHAYLNKEVALNIDTNNNVYFNKLNNTGVNSNAEIKEYRIKNKNNNLPNQLYEDENSKFNQYIQMCMELNNNKTFNNFNCDFNLNSNANLDENNETNILENYPKIFTENNNSNQISDENYENFTQEFFRERYKQFIPSNYLTPTSFNKNISQFLKKEKPEKSEYSNRIINIKCDTNIDSTISNKIKNMNVNDQTNLNRNSNNNRLYFFSEPEKNDLSKFDFANFLNELVGLSENYQLSPFPFLEDFNMPFYFNIHSCCSLYRWVVCYNKVIQKESLLKELNLNNFLIIDPDLIYDLIKESLNSDFKNDQSFKAGVKQSFDSKNKYEIFSILTRFFKNFSITFLEEKLENIIILEVKAIKFIDSLKIMELKDFFNFTIDVAYVLPNNFYENNNCWKKETAKTNRKKCDVDIGDVILLLNRSKKTTFLDNSIYFIDDKDFEIITY